MTRVLISKDRQPESGDIRAAVIFLHGYGANGADLLGLADVLAPHMPDVLFLAPDAPEHIMMSPVGLQWFPIPWIDGSSEEDAAKLLAEDAPIVLKGLNSEPVKRGRPWTHDDDEDLLRENDNGSLLSFMAAEFERSERAIMERLKKLGAHYHGTAHMCQSGRGSGSRHSPVAA